MEEEKEPEGNCQHLQVLMTYLLRKHWQWHEHREGEPKHGFLRHPTTYVAIMDIKTALDVAKPKYIAQTLEEQNMHGWLIGALLREIAGLAGEATSESVESKFHEMYQTTV